MKRLLLTGVAALAFAAPAVAADLPVRAYKAVPPPIVPVYDWSGFYVGGHIGGAWVTQEATNTARTAAFGDLSPGQGASQKGSGVFGGGQIGYNWQVSNVVFGLEGTLAGIDIKKSLLNTEFGARDDEFSWKLEWLATVTGRLGIAVNNNLFYAKGGYAGVQSKLSVSDVVLPFVGSGSDSQLHNGWTVGAGWEYGLTRNWIVGLEYAYYSFETKNYQLAGAAAPATYAFDVKPKDLQSAVVRLSYKFGGPVLAKY